MKKEKGKGMQFFVGVSKRVGQPFWGWSLFWVDFSGKDGAISEPLEFDNIPDAMYARKVWENFLVGGSAELDPVTEGDLDESSVL
jgi:hypothetical protein